MLIFLVPKGVDPREVLAPVPVVLLDYQDQFPRLKSFDVVPWYHLMPDPEALAAYVLRIASEDPVCVSVLYQAERDSSVQHRLVDSMFTDERLQAHYIKLLRNWLSPLSGNVGKDGVTAHEATVQAQFLAVWKKYGLDLGELTKVAALPFFARHSNAGRRDRAQIYRNITEFARAIIGEVTCWASRKVEKIVAYRLARSPGLAHCQRQMLAAVITERVALKCRMWEYVPYFLRGLAGERAEEGFAEVRVLGALHDALADGEDTAALVNAEHVTAFRLLADGHEYARWRALPRVVRYQALISDLARIMPGGKIDSAHVRIQANEKSLSSLPKGQESWPAWPCGYVAHKIANPHEPGRDFPHASGWVRNEFCPNVVTSRMLLAPLYAGTSGHTQGRILAWRELGVRANLPVHLVIPAGYIALWRLYYDKRVSGFHTPFETLQGAFCADDMTAGIPRIRFDNDDAWNEILDHLGNRGDLKALWTHWLTRLGALGRSRIDVLDSRLGEERVATMGAEEGTVIPKWSVEDNPTRTGTEVASWSLERIERALDRASLRNLTEAPLRPPLSEEQLLQMQRLIDHAASVPLPEDDGIW